MKSADSTPDDELVRRIQEAFEQVSVPECPSLEEWMRGSETNAVTGMTPSSISDDHRSTSWITNLIVLAAMAGIAIFFVRSMNEDPKFDPTQEEVDGIVDAETVPPMEAVASQDDTKDESTNASQENQDETPVNELVAAISTVNRILEGSVDVSDVLNEPLHEQLGLERSNLQAALLALEQPKGITSIQRGVARERTWVIGATQTAFTYRFEFPQILGDLKRFIDGYFGDRIFYEILDGLRDDLDGPQVDLRKDLFPLLAGEMILVVDKRPEPSDETATIVLLVKDTTKAWSVIGQLHRAEPDTSIKRYKDVEMLIVESNDSKQTAWAIVGNCLIIGGPQNVQSTIDRAVTR